MVTQSTYRAKLKGKKRKQQQQKKSFVSLHIPTEFTNLLFHNAINNNQRNTRSKVQHAEKSCQQDRLWAPSLSNELLIIARLPYLADRLRASAEHMEPAELHHHLGRKQRLRRCITICCLKTFTRACGLFFFCFFFFSFTGFPSVMNTSRPTASGPQEKACWMGRPEADF